MRIVCISDTHLTHETRDLKIPNGDILIHAGDSTYMGNLREIGIFYLWFKSLPHRHKILVAGNHDWIFQKNNTVARAMLPPRVKYLEHEMAEIEGLKIFGSPWQPVFLNWAFNLPRGAALKQKWDQVPEGVDILVTHSPPAGILDKTHGGERVGCEDMRAMVKRVKPKLHVFGHIHPSYGQEEVDGTRFVNASICNDKYHPANDPIVVDL